MKFKIVATIFLLPLMFIACKQFNVAQDDVVARVGNHYLYQSDLENLMIKSLSIQDSLVKVKGIINDWARDILLHERSLINLSDSKIKSLDMLVAEYEMDIFSNAYNEFVIKASLDTIVSDSEVQSFYDSNKAIFKLNHPLYRVRFIQLPLDHVKRKEITKRFRLFNDDDRQFLDSLSYQFSEYFLNDTVWISKNYLFNKSSFLNNDNLSKYIKKSQFFEVKDSLEVYLFVAKDYIGRNEFAPIEYIDPTIKNIILNKRKLEFLKQFNKEILQDAIKSKKLEIY